VSVGNFKGIPLCRAFIKAAVGGSNTLIDNVRQGAVMDRWANVTLISLQETMPVLDHTCSCLLHDSRSVH
jgi:hypothetical protein